MPVVVVHLDDVSILDGLGAALGEVVEALPDPELARGEKKTRVGRERGLAYEAVLYVSRRRFLLTHMWLNVTISIVGLFTELHGNAWAGTTYCMHRFRAPPLR